MWLYGDARHRQWLQDVWRSHLTKRGYGGRNLNLFNEEWYYPSGTPSKLGIALFRIRNRGTVTAVWS
jgi:hypothetical protein